MRERGNILFLILLAVVLFAALSYAVTSSLRGGGNGSTEENAKVQAAAILGFIKQVDLAVMRMRMTNNIPFENISFRYTVTMGNGTTGPQYTNANCISNACRVFLPDGGGATPTVFTKAAAKDPTGWDISWPAPGHFDFYTYQWPNAGTSANDIAMRVIALDPLVCQEINMGLGRDKLTYTTLVNIGTPQAAHIPANWDVGAYGCGSGNCELLSNTDTVIQGSITTGPGNYCQVLHLLYAR